MTPGSSAWTTSMTTSPTRRGWIAGALVAMTIVAVSALAMAKSPGGALEVTTPIEVLPPIVGPEPTAPGEPVAVVVDGDFSMRATTVGLPIAGGEMILKLEIWDEDDEPIDAGQVAATVRSPGGATVAFGIPGRGGVFELRQPTMAAGTHVVSVFAPSGETTFTVRVEVSRRPLS
jgi:hypothetical protein